MKCDDCKKDFEECKIEESHDIPCYLFEGNRKGQKNQADKFGRHQLCYICHHRYENELRLFLRTKAKQFSNDYFQTIEEIIEDDSIPEL